MREVDGSRRCEPATSLCFVSFPRRVVVEEEFDREHKLLVGLGCEAGIIIIQNTIIVFFCWKENGWGLIPSLVVAFSELTMKLHIYPCLLGGGLVCGPDYCV